MFVLNLVELVISSGVCAGLYLADMICLDISMFATEIGEIVLRLVELLISS